MPGLRQACPAALPRLCSNLLLQRQTLGSTQQALETPGGLPPVARSHAGGAIAAGAGLLGNLLISHLVLQVLDCPELPWAAQVRFWAARMAPNFIRTISHAAHVSGSDRAPRRGHTVLACRLPMACAACCGSWGVMTCPSGGTPAPSTPPPAQPCPTPQRRSSTQTTPPRDRRSAACACP